MVLNLLIKCTDITFASYFTSIATESTTYAKVEAKMVAKYGKHRHQVMWEIYKLREGQN